MYTVTIKWLDNDKNICTTIRHFKNKNDAIELISEEIEWESTINVQCRQVNINEGGAFIK